MINSNSSCYDLFSKMIVTAFTILIGLGCSGLNVIKLYENGAVISPSEIANEIALEVIKEGGNAFDASVAASLTLSVVKPQLSNIGGGGVAIIRDARNNKIEILDFAGSLPSSYQNIKDTIGKTNQSNDYGNSTIPGTISGLFELHRKYGTVSWEKLVGYAANLADTGFIVDIALAEEIRSYYRNSTISDNPESIFSVDGKMLESGQRLVQTELAKALYLVATEGKDGFYSGELADSLVSTVQQSGGKLTGEDLSGYESFWMEPLKLSYDSLEVYTMPPGMGGMVIAQILKIAEQIDFSRLVANSSDYLHLYSEISKMAFAERAINLNNPEFYNIAGNNFLSENYIKSRFDLIDENHSLPSNQMSHGRFETKNQQGSNYLIIADKNGNIVSLSFNLSGMDEEKKKINGFGFYLNNDLDLYSTDFDADNYIGKYINPLNENSVNQRLLATALPTIVINREEPFMVFGTSNDFKSISAVTQSIINYTNFNTPINKLYARGRFHHQSLPDILYLGQNDFSIDVKQDLIKKGHNVEEKDIEYDISVFSFTPAGLVSGATEFHKGRILKGFK